MCASFYLYYYRVLDNNGQSSSRIEGGYPMGRFRLIVQWASILTMQGICIYYDIDKLLDWRPNIAYYKCILPVGYLHFDSG